MYNRYIWVIASFFALMALPSCKKNHSDDISLCYHRKYYSSSTWGKGLSDSQMDSVKFIFKNNDLSLQPFQILGTYYPYNYDAVIISVKQFVGGLLVFNAETGIQFLKINGDYQLDPYGPNPVGFVHAPPIDSSYKISPAKAVETFYKKIKNLRVEGSDWKDSCFEVTLGVGLINGLSGFDSDAEYGLVWKVNPQGKDCPFSFVNAKTGELALFRANCAIF